MVIRMRIASSAGLGLRTIRRDFGRKPPKRGNDMSGEKI